MGQSAIRSLFASVLLAVTAGAAPSGQDPVFHWSRLSSIPDGEGFAGAFAGVSAGALVVAGGANIPEARWENPPKKRWHSGVFILEGVEGKWIVGGELPRALGYGVSATTATGIICAGGSDAQRHYQDTFELRWKHGVLETITLPRLPRPCANACGAILNGTLYIAGGSEGPDSSSALNQFLALDLGDLDKGWRELEPWPGPGRILAVAGACDGSFFLFSGASLHVAFDGKPARTYLKDAYRYIPAKGWQRLADLPRAAVAAPSPAPALGLKQLLVMGGDDGGRLDFVPLEKHPGFSRELLAYDLAGDRWSTLETLSIAPVTVPAVSWGSGIVIPNGEVRPRVRTPEVWMFSTGGKP